VRLLSRKRFLLPVFFPVLLCFCLVLSVKAEATKWHQTYEGPESYAAQSLVATYDGGYALARDSLLVKTDAAGNMEWSQTYGNPAENVDIAYALIATSDGGYALAGGGTVGPYTAGDSDFWLIKTGELGNAPEAAWAILPLLFAATVSIFVSKKLFPKRSRERWIFT
jgi:hypothetical protein